MAFVYKVVERKNKLHNNTPQHYAVQINQGTVSTREIAQQLQEITSLGRGDVMNVLEHLGDICIRQLREGRSVKIGNVGTLTPYIRSKAVPEGEDFTVGHIKGLRIAYRPSKWLLDELSKTSYACRTDKGMCPMPAEPAPKETPKHSEADNSTL